VVSITYKDTGTTAEAVEEEQVGPSTRTRTSSPSLECVHIGAILCVKSSPRSTDPPPKPAQKLLRSVRSCVSFHARSKAEALPTGYIQSGARPHREPEGSEILCRPGSIRLCRFLGKTNKRPHWTKEVTTSTKSLRSSTQNRTS
jgi:hypothetical protein